MKKHFKKYVPIIICTSIAFFAACRHEKERAKQNNEAQNVSERIDERDELLRIRR